jgi:uracil-DNA glycosylase
MAAAVPAGWRRVLAAEVAQPSYRRLWRFIARERRLHGVFPLPRQVFAALRLVPYSRVRVVIRGQDPYPSPGHAHGLAFSVMPGVPLPPSLVNICAELRHDLGLPAPKSGSLVPWARQGVLLLNTVLTVRAHQPGSHRGHGWESFTDAIITALNARPAPVVFVLWGQDAQRAASMIDRPHHTIIRGAHPSPMSAARGFFGSRPFSKINAALRAAGEQEIDWRLADI